MTTTLKVSFEPLKPGNGTQSSFSEMASVEFLHSTIYLTVLHLFSRRCYSKGSTFSCKDTAKRDEAQYSFDVSCKTDEHCHQ